MNCIKCGRETQAEQAFCLDCQLEMEKYPVKPGTYVKLPERREQPGYRRSMKRRTVNTDEQIRVLKHRVRHLTIGLLLCMVIIAGMLYYISSQLMQAHHKPGQNYSVIPATEAQEAAQPEAETTAAPTQ